MQWSQRHVLLVLKRMIVGVNSFSTMTHISFCANCETAAEAFLCCQDSVWKEIRHLTSNNQKEFEQRKPISGVVSSFKTASKRYDNAVFCATVPHYSCRTRPPAPIHTQRRVTQHPGEWPFTPPVLVVGSACIYVAPFQKAATED